MRPRASPASRSASPACSAHAVAEGQVVHGRAHLRAPDAHGVRSGEPAGPYDADVRHALADVHDHLCVARTDVEAAAERGGQRLRRDADRARARLVRGLLERLDLVRLRVGRRAHEHRGPREHRAARSPEQLLQQHARGLAVHDHAGLHRGRSSPRPCTRASDGSSASKPRPRAYTRVNAVPRSTATSGARFRHRAKSIRGL